MSWRQFNDRITSEIIAFWHAFRYRLNRLFKKNPPVVVNPHAHSLTIFVHGYLGDSSCWRPWLDYFTQRGHNVATFDLGLDHPLQTIDELADRLDLFVRDFIVKYGKHPPKIRLVGHSLGGIIAATYALRQPQNIEISSIISLAAPLKGAKLARAAKWVFSKCGEDMKPESRHLKKLQYLFQAHPHKTRFHYAAAKHDDIVALDHTTLGDVADVFSVSCNHMGIIYQDDARDWVQGVLEG